MCRGVERGKEVQQPGYPGVFSFLKNQKKTKGENQAQKIDTSNFNFQRELQVPELKLRRRGAMA